MIQSSLTASLLIIALAIGLIVSAAVRGGLRFRRAREQRLDPPLPKLLLPAIASAVGGIAASGAIIYGASLFAEPGLALPLACLAGAGTLSSLTDFAAQILWASAKPARSRLDKLSPYATLIAGASLLGYVFYLRSVPNCKYGTLQAYRPLCCGYWRVVTGGRDAMTNYHHNNPAGQNYAIDLVADFGNTAGQNVYAPVDGKVVQAVGDRIPGDEPAEGNYVVIETTKGVQVWLAHLAENSVTVTSGSQVAFGTPIGRVGATGSAEFPHLHIHAECNQEAVPILMDEHERFLVRGDTIYFRPSP